MKKRILLSSLLTLSIVACTSPILNNTSQYSDLDQEYSQFKTKALTQSYLKKKMDKWLSDVKYSKNLVREIEYAKFKHKDLLKDIVALQPTMFNSITGNTGVTQKRSEPSFENYIEYIDPFPHGITATSATNIADTSFTANWTSVGNATGYKLYIDGSATPITLGLVTTYNVTGLVEASSHNYYVKATNSAGESSVSNTINLTLLSALPSAPTANIASAITSTSFTANWTSVSNATGYKLYIDGTPITLGLVTTYNVTGLVDGTAHNYYVKATNSAGESSISNTINLTLLSALPSAPTANTASAITSTSFTANWGAVTGATGYKLFIDGTPITLGLVTTYNKTGLTAGTSHSYYVKTINAGGDSSSSNTINLTLLLDAPTAISATTITSSSFTANWNSVTNATGYKLYIDGTPITLGLVTTYNVTGLVDGSSHSYYVKVINSDNIDSSSSNTINLTLLSTAPVATLASDLTPTSFIANWNAVTGATGYKLYLDGNATPIILGNVTNYEILNLTAGTGHNYYVKAITSLGDSANSNTITFTLPLDITASANWNIVEGNWQFSPPLISFLSNPSRSGGAIILTKNINVKNFTTIMRAKADSTSSSPSIIFRANGSNYYQFEWDGRVNQISLMRSSNWTYVTSYYTKAIESNKWYTFKVVAHDNNIKCYIDNTLYFDVNDTTFTTSGQVGFRNWSTSSTTYKDISIIQE